MQPMDAGTRALLAPSTWRSSRGPGREHVHGHGNCEGVRRRLARGHRARPRARRSCPSQHPPPLRHPRIRGARQPGGGRRARSRRARRGGLGASGQEELYLVLSGKATFNVDGEPIYATAGTMVFVRDPAAKRSAVAKEEGTTILAIGGTPGRAYALGRRGDARHVGALPGGGLRGRPRSAPAGARGAAGGARPLQRRLHGGEARRTDDAISHLEQAIEDDDRIKEHIRTDGDQTRYGRIRASRR